MPALIFGCLAWAVFCAVRWREFIGWLQAVRALIWACACWAIMTLALSWFAAKMFTPIARHPTDWVSLSAAVFSILAATGFESAVTTHGLRGAIPQAFREALVGKRTRRLIAAGLLLTVLLEVAKSGALKSGLIEPTSGVRSWLDWLSLAGQVCAGFGLFSACTRAVRTRARDLLPWLALVLGLAGVAAVFVLTSWVMGLQAELLKTIRHSLPTTDLVEWGRSEEERMDLIESSQDVARFMYQYAGEAQAYYNVDGKLVPFQPTEDDRQIRDSWARWWRNMEYTPWAAALIAALGMLVGLLLPRRVDRITRPIEGVSRSMSSGTGTT